MRLPAITFLLLLFATVAFAQPEDSVQIEEADSLELEMPIKYKTQSKLKVNRISIGIDTYPLIFTMVEPDFTGATAHVGMSFADRFWVQADIGYENNRRRNSSPFYEYRTYGIFARLGADYNLTYWKVPRDAFLFGLHFGYASFGQEVNYPSINQTWRHLMEEVTATGITATWLEPRGTLQVRAFEKLSLEAVLGIRIRMGMQGYEAFPNEVPGFGVLKSRARLSVGYRICYVLDFD